MNIARLGAWAALAWVGASAYETDGNNMFLHHSDMPMTLKVIAGALAWNLRNLKIPLIGSLVGASNINDGAASATNPQVWKHKVWKAGAIGLPIAFPLAAIATVWTLASGNIGDTNVATGLAGVWATAISWAVNQVRISNAGWDQAPEPADVAVVDDKSANLAARLEKIEERLF